MKEISIDETKLPAVMEMIKKAAEIMSEKDCANDEAAKQDLESLQQKLRKITGNKQIRIKDFQRYWSAIDLETVAREALMVPPSKDDLTNAQIREIVLNIFSFNEDEMDWWLKYLKINTGLDNLTDYIFYPNRIGLDPQAALEQIANKIIADRK